MHVFVSICKQKLYILKIELFLGIHTILRSKKSALRCFKCYREKRLHNFVNRLEIGTTIILLSSYCHSTVIYGYTLCPSNQLPCVSYLMPTPNFRRYEASWEAVPLPDKASNRRGYCLYFHWALSLLHMTFHQG